MGLFVFWLTMGGVVAIIANSKGKSAGAWFLCGVLIWPIALVHILVTQADKTNVETKAISQGELRKCPRCAELIKREAVICRFCQGALAPL